MTSSIKTCGACLQALPSSSFAFKDKAKGRLQSKCRECASAYAKEHYACNTAAYLAKARDNNAVYRQRNQGLVERALHGQTCCGCGTGDELTFYNGGVDQGQPVHMAVNAGLSEQAVLQAIATSVVVCRRCLGAHFGQSLQFWQKLTSEQRKQLQHERRLQGHTPRPEGFYKAYRRVEPAVSTS